MTALEQYRERPAEVATIPQAAAGLVEWAHAAQAAHTLAQSLVQTAFVPQQYRGKPAEATAAILAGAELGLNPLASLRAFDNIQGTAAPKAITLRAVAQSRGHKVDIVEESPVKVVARYRRVDETDWKYVEWTIEQARDLGLTSKDNWKKQPKAMLVARATSEASRRAASDALLGIPYSAEELADEAGPTTKVSRPVTRVQRQRPAAPEPPEPEFDDPPPDVSSREESAPEPEPMITDAQLKKLHAALRDAQITDRDAGLAYISQEIGRDVTTTKELTRREASAAIDSLGAQPTIPDPDGGGES